MQSTDANMQTSKDKRQIVVKKCNVKNAFSGETFFAKKFRKGLDKTDDGW